MKPRPRWARLTLIVGALALLAGAIDPLEGSVVILGGCALLAASAALRGDSRRHCLYWKINFALVALGVAAVFALSSVGGIGGRTGRSLWWGLLILPYPIGWLLGVGGVIARVFRHRCKTPPEG